MTRIAFSKLMIFMNFSKNSEMLLEIYDRICHKFANASIKQQGYKNGKISFGTSQFSHLVDSVI
jgi:hypothetical protein